MSNKVELVQKAQEKLREVIDLLEETCRDDENAKAYIVDHLKIICSSDHCFFSRDLNLDDLIKRYEIDKI
jgi:hypothetical protein